MGQKFVPARLQILPTMSIFDILVRLSDRGDKAESKKD
jgi:hypothetical protein